MKKIGTILQTKNIIEENDFSLKKRFGQNFLVDQNVLNAIVNKAEINKNVNVIEIGPGIGSLTELLIENANHVIAYEIDDKLIPILENEFKDKKNFTLIHEDILKADIISDINKYFNLEYPIYVVANLPYYITTPIIMELLENISCISKYVVMVQEEVADRFAAKVGTKEYNSLSIVINYYAEVSKILKVSKNVFMPKPNVDSAVVLFKIRQEKLYNLDEKKFFTFVRNCFANRRKTLVNNISQAYKIDKSTLETGLNELSLPITIRSEALTLDQFVKLFAYFKI